MKTKDRNSKTTDLSPQQRAWVTRRRNERAASRKSTTSRKAA